MKGTKYGVSAHAPRPIAPRLCKLKYTSRERILNSATFTSELCGSQSNEVVVFASAGLREGKGQPVHGALQKVVVSLAGSMTKARAGSFAAMAALCVSVKIAAAQERPSVSEVRQPVTMSPINAQGELVEYSANFFNQYHPRTALDMVEQLPGFQINDGGGSRGFAAAAGNVLINSRRPSSKQRSVSDILDRIPVSQVAYIELIRGQVRDINLGGFSVVANVVLGDVASAVTQWELLTEKNVDLGPLTIEGSMSLSDEWSGIEYNAGFTAAMWARGERSTERVLDAEGIVTEERFDDSATEGPRGSVYLNGSTLLGDTLLGFNARVEVQRDEELTTSHRIPQAFDGPPRTELFSREEDEVDIEVGTDLERQLRENLSGRAIFLYTREGVDTASAQRVLDAADRQSLMRGADSSSAATEGIARLELDWSGLPDHTVQASLEGAYNALDSELEVIRDTGAGPVPVPVPVANTRIEETRWNLLIEDTWTLGRFDLSYGLGAEYSTITQTGDASRERSFSFLKPQTALTFAPTDERQMRLRIVREVGQLDFDDFASATEFEDDDFALGNPDLRPESTWIAELSHTRRFDGNVIRLTAFHHWISDTVDLLPLTPTIEVPGNIGNSRRWGLEVGATFALDGLGLSGAMLDIEARWQDSVVEDPVTGNDRVLSGERGRGGDGEGEYDIALTYRQDFERARVAWGWELRERAERLRFKVDELDVHYDATDLNAFIETTRWFGLRFRLEARLLRTDGWRDRTIFSGKRRQSPVAYREITDPIISGTRIALSLSGTF